MIHLRPSTTASRQSGGRKSATARVTLVSSPESTIFVNGKLASLYFQNNSVYLQHLMMASDLVESQAHYEAHVSVAGGGLSAQAQAVRLVLSKAYSELFPDLRVAFKEPGFLTRDARIKERRKYGLKKARKASQFSKR